MVHQSSSREKRQERTARPARSGGDGEFHSLSLAFLDRLYADYLRDPDSIAAEWREQFERLGRDERAAGDGRKKTAAPPRGRNGRLAGPSFRPRSIFDPGGGDGRLHAGEIRLEALQERVDQLIRNYRVRGHIIAQVDPLGQEKTVPAELMPEFYGFTDEDYNREFSTATVRGPRRRTLREIIGWLQNTYCRSIGVQYMHIDSLTARAWLQDRMEPSENRITLQRDEQIRILKKLSDAVVFEEFIQKKYLGAKSFSLEGAESLIPLLDQAIETAGADGVREIVIGMAHRGRLNVLANVIGKSPREIFREFEDRDPELHLGRGDVKYHLGYSSDWELSTGGKVHISLCFNPSHLEFVNPVALGRMRAKQDRFGDAERSRGLVLLIHGDASFIGEGVVQESLNLSELPGYTTGGTIHVIVNNQLGFTTPAQQGRSSVYASDVAKMLQSPIFHVNGEDPEAVAQVVHVALDFRRKFQRDVVIDMYCYRLRGHNEGDEPSFTQPVMYRAIEERPSVRESYLERLLALDGITREEAEAIIEERKAHLEEELKTARSEEYAASRFDTLGGIWEGYLGGRAADAADVETGVEKERLARLLDVQTRFPDDFHPHPKIERGLKARRKMAAGEAPLDWSAAESLAFASLATEGIRVRLSGQDSERGTFSQRHAVLHDYQDGRTYVPLQHLADDQAPMEIYNSPLSEAGVLGFEYGYSLDCPDGLVLWEAQFGDFANAAQVIIDQFLASAEDKWQRLSGLVLLLPHGFEGQGPEHSSARLERFLMLAAEDNIQIAQPTTPAQYFHLLRRQVLRRWRKPLIVLTPKSLLRHKAAVSELEDLAEGSFQQVIGDSQSVPDADSIRDAERASRIERVLLCSGKIYYELTAKRDELNRSDTAIVRLEQLYPLPAERLRENLAGYRDGTPTFWVQEEPENMGAWRFLRSHWCGTLFDRLPFSCISRPPSASPATGSGTAHKMEQQQLLADAFGEGKGV